MSNSSLVDITMISPNRNSPRNKPIDRVSVHCFVGQVSAKRGLEVFKPTSKQASCNYVIGFDGSVGLCVEEKDRSWCTSSAANDNRAITIEVASENREPYMVTRKAYEKLIDLLTDICRRNGKTRLVWFGDKAKTLAYKPGKTEMVMTVHRWFANKSCPGAYLYGQHTAIANEVTKRLGGGIESPTSPVPFLVRVNIPDLYIRAGNSVKTPHRGFCPIGVYTIVETAPGEGATMWGRLKSGRGWISLDYAKRV